MTEEQIMQIAQQLGLALAQSDAYRDWQQAEDAFKLDGEAQDLLSAAETLRNQLRTKLEEGTPPDQLQEGLQQLRDLNTALSECKTLNQLNQARTAFQGLLSRIDTLLKFYTGRGEEECGGECSTCGGCG